MYKAFPFYRQRCQYKTRWISLPLSPHFLGIYLVNYQHRPPILFPRETCAVLMSKGSDVTARDIQQSTPLHLAVEVGSLETVRLLLTPMLPNTLEVKDKDQNTPLHVAGMHNRVEILKFLMDQGADVAARNSKNMTCLDEAIEWNSVEVAETLVRHKR